VHRDTDKGGGCVEVGGKMGWLRGNGGLEQKFKEISSPVDGDAE